MKSLILMIEDCIGYIEKPSNPEIFMTEKVKT